SVPLTAFVRGTRVACACVAKLPRCSWLAPHLHAFRLGDVFRDNFPARAHLPHLPIIARGIFEVQLWSVPGFAALKTRFHFCIQNAGDEQGPLDRIWRPPFTEMRL